MLSLRRFTSAETALTTPLFTSTLTTGLDIESGRVAQRYFLLNFGNFS